MQKMQMYVLGLCLMMASMFARAALPAEAAGAFTTLSGNVTDLLAAIWPIVATCVGGFVLIRLFRRGANTVA